MIIEIERLEEELKNSPGNYSIREKIALHLYQLLNRNEISNEKYLSKAEVLFREHLQIDPSHDICKQQLASVLQKKLLHLNEENPNIKEQELLLRELVQLSPLPRFKRNLAKILNTQYRESTSLEELTQMIIEILYPSKSNLSEKINKFLFANDELLLDQEKIEPTLEELIEIAPTEKQYREKLAYLYFFRAIKKMDTASPPLHQLFLELQTTYRKCIELDPENTLYQQRWLDWLQKVEEELSRTDGENVQVRVQVLEEMLCYDKGNSVLKNKLENILHDEHERIEEQWEEKKISERTYVNELQNVYSKLMRLDSGNLVYKHSMAKLLHTDGMFQKGDQNDRAYKLFQDVLRLNPAHEDALLRMAIIHIYKSEITQAYELVHPLIEKGHQRRGKELTLQLYTTYAVIIAHINRVEEAYDWLRKAKDLDANGKYRFEIASAKRNVDTCSSILYYRVKRIGIDSQVLDNVGIDQLLHEFEEHPQRENLSKIFFDFRDLDCPKIIGPTSTKLLVSTSKVDVITYLLESLTPRSINEIREHCETASREMIKNIREKDLAKVFSATVDDIEAATSYVKGNVLVHVHRSGYQWVFQGETYLITSDL